MAEISKKQDDFCRCYALTGNATKSHQEAFGSGYSTARTEGSKLLTNPNILAKIDEYRDYNRSDLILLTSDIKSRLKKAIISQLDDHILSAEAISDRVKQINKLSLNQLRVLSQVRSTEIDMLSKLVDLVYKLEGLDIIEYELIEKERAKESDA